MPQKRLRRPLRGPVQEIARFLKFRGEDHVRGVEASWQKGSTSFTTPLLPGLSRLQACWVEAGSISFVASLCVSHIHLQGYEDEAGSSYFRRTWLASRRGRAASSSRFRQVTEKSYMQISEEPWAKPGTSPTWASSPCGPPYREELEWTGRRAARRRWKWSPSNSNSSEGTGSCQRRTPQKSAE